MPKSRLSSSVQTYSIVVLAVILQVSSSVLAGDRVPAAGSSAAITQILAVDIYSDQGGQGSNKTMGTYTIGDTVKFYIYISRNSTIQETVITPNGSVWSRVAGPVNSGTIIDYFDTEYPTGEWAISVKAYAENDAVTDTAPYEVVDKEPYVCTKTSLFNISGSTGEIGLTGKVVKIYRYPAGGVRSWDVQVDNAYFGPDIRNQTVHVQMLAVTHTLRHPPGHLDENITLGYEVAVCDLLNGQSVSVNGSVSYYFVKLSTLCEQTHPQTPQTGPKRIGLRVGEALIVAMLLVTATIAIRKKHPQLRRYGSNESPAHEADPEPSDC